MEATVPVRTSIVMPSDIAERYLALSLYGGFYVTLTSGDFTVEGVLLAVMRPSSHSDAAGVIVVIDTGTERITGPVLSGDRLQA